MVVIRSIVAIVLVGAVVYLLGGCRSSREIASSLDNGDTRGVHITRFYPRQAHPGEALEVIGRGFSAVSDSNEVFIGNVKVRVDGVWTYADTRSGTLFITIPEGASDAPIGIRVNGGALVKSDSVFRVIPW